VREHLHVEHEVEPEHGEQEAGAGREGGRHGGSMAEVAGAVAAPPRAP
jgi:hypothetical protein